MVSHSSRSIEAAPSNQRQTLPPVAHSLAVDRTVGNAETQVQIQEDKYRLDLLGLRQGAAENCEGGPGMKTEPGSDAASGDGRPGTRCAQFEHVIGQQIERVAGEHPPIPGVDQLERRRTHAARRARREPERQ